jgi:D-sedoheptulose 7-phosphate isomerase
VKRALLEDSGLVRLIAKVGREFVVALRTGHKILLFGNGGSAADAQHIAAELVGRYQRERRALPALALTTNSSSVTAIGNDYSFEDVFARQVEALGSKGDVAVGISTSGKAVNVLRGVAAANAKGLLTVGLTGKEGGELRKLVKYYVGIPADTTPRIQEAHMLIGHVLAEIVERELFVGRSTATPVGRSCGRRASGYRFLNRTEEAR